MALVRILVDGYSLLHQWPELARGKPRHSAAAREALLRILTQYRDACGTPLTVVFDGIGQRRCHPDHPSTPDVEVLYSGAGQTADDLIERATHRLLDYGEVLVVTDDVAERDTVSSLGALTWTCASFIDAVERELADLQRDLRHHNRRERQRFGRLK
jgi:predicted RNA-binding protein with PIN domain